MKNVELNINIHYNKKKLSICVNCGKQNEVFQVIDLLSNKKYFLCKKCIEKMADKKQGVWSNEISKKRRNKKT